MEIIDKYHENYPNTGIIKWIGIRPSKKEKMIELNSACIIEGKGLEGDRSVYNSEGIRHITLFQYEYLEVLSKLLNNNNIRLSLLRRNIAIEGINILSLIDKEFYLGTALLAGTGNCHPCSKMEENLGYGGYNAMVGHGGITAKVITGAIIRIGDFVKLKTIS